MAVLRIWEAVMNKLTVVVIVLLAIAAAAYIIYRIVKAKLRELSRAAFGTDSLTEGWNRPKN